MSEATRTLERRTQTAILISENADVGFHEYARRFDDYGDAYIHAIDIQHTTQRLLTIKLKQVETYYLVEIIQESPDHYVKESSDIDHFEALKDFAELIPGVSIPRPQMNEGDTLEVSGTVTLTGDDDDEIPF